MDRERDRSIVRGVVAGSAAVLAGTAALVVAFLRLPYGTTPTDANAAPRAAIEASATPTAPPAVPESSAPGSPVPPSGTPSPRPSPRPGVPSTPGGPGSTGPATAASLTARYDTDDDSITLVAYRASVTITNPGTVPVTGWTLTIRLPRSTQSIGDVSGATVRRDDETWTFTPLGSTTTVVAGGRVVVSFQVNGAVLLAQPTACAINGRPCEGLS